MNHDDDREGDAIAADIASKNAEWAQDDGSSPIVTHDSLAGNLHPFASTNQERGGSEGFCGTCQKFVSDTDPCDPFAGVRAGHALLDDVKAQYEGWQKDEPVSKKALRIVERYFEDKPYDGELRGQLFDLIMGAFR